MSETDLVMDDEISGGGEEEPTMEEILSSIRKIISDDDVAETSEDETFDEVMEADSDSDEDEILELTEILSEEEGEVDFNQDFELLSPDDVDDLVFTEAIEESDPVEDVAPSLGISESLISDQTGEQVNSSFNLLANTMLAQNGAGQTVESMVMSLMRPMLKSWLDDNLPIMVEKIIREEIERVARGGKM